MSTRENVRLIARASLIDSCQAHLPCNTLRTWNLFARSDTGGVIDSEPHRSHTCKTSILFVPLAVRVHTLSSPLRFYTKNDLLQLYIKNKTVFSWIKNIFIYQIYIIIFTLLCKNWINFLNECIIGLDKQKILVWFCKYFLTDQLNICFGCSKEPSHWDGSFEYPQHMFRLRFNILVHTLN